MKKNTTIQLRVGSGEHRSFAFRLSPFAFRRGFTLYEILIYIALFLVLAVLIVGFVIQLLQTGYRVSRSREVLTSVSTALRSVTDTARFAQGVYAPTSVFSSDAGQLSLETAVNPPAGEATTYTDFYLDNGRFFIKRESEEAFALTSERVRVTHFRIIRLNPIATSESLRVAITAEHRFAPASQNTGFAATTTVTLRRY